MPLYMTLGEFQTRLNNLIRDTKGVDKNVLVADALVVKSDSPAYDDEFKTYPPGTIIFLCKNSADNQHKISEKWYELSIMPDSVGKWKQ